MKLGLTIAKRPVAISVTVIRSGLVANKCDSSASERRSAASALTRAVMSKYSDSDAGPSTVSTRTPVACTISRRPVREISWKSSIGKPSPTAILSSCPMRSRARACEAASA